MGKYIYLVLLNILAVYAELYIHEHPPAVNFKPTEKKLDISELPNVLAASLGYSTKSLNWPGLSITCPIGYPEVATIFVIKSDASGLKLSGLSYELNEDIPFDEAYYEFKNLILSQSEQVEQTASVEYIDVTDLMNEVDLPRKADREAELSAVKNLPDHLKKSQGFVNVGRKVNFIELNSFADFGGKDKIGSAEVKQDAVRSLNETLFQVASQLSDVFPKRILVTSIIVSSDVPTIDRQKRQARIDDNIPVPKQFQNIAASYGNDFPVIFNIVLILSIILIVSLIASSVAIAFMDPGRDSIIYRMTNPRMKKDQ